MGGACRCPRPRHAITPVPSLARPHPGRVTGGCSPRTAAYQPAAPARPLTVAAHATIRRAAQVFFRDVAAASGQSAFALTNALRKDLLAFNPFLLYDEEDANALVRRAEFTAFVGALGGVLFFGPVLSVAVLYAKHALLSRLRSSASYTPPPQRDLLRLQRATVRAKLARLGVLDPHPHETEGQRRHTVEILTDGQGVIRRAITTGSIETHTGSPAGANGGLCA